jgi:hypothetical protein
MVLDKDITQNSKLGYSALDISHEPQLRLRSLGLTWTPEIHMPSRKLEVFHARSSMGIPNR